MNTIQEIATDIARELRIDPTRWTQYSYARNSDGLPAFLHSEEARTWCLMGHVKKRVPAGKSTSRFMLQLHTAVGVPAATWNDAPERSVQDIIELCDRIATS